MGLFSKLLGGGDTPTNRLDVTEAGAADGLDVEPVPHNDYRIFSFAKQLHNGRWVVEVKLEGPPAGGGRRYDLAGPMRDYVSDDEARRAGIDFAIERIEMLGSAAG